MSTQPPGRPVTDAADGPVDWTAHLLAGATVLDVPAARRDPVRWPGYAPRSAVRVWRVPAGAVAAVWDFSVYGGSFGEDDATALVAAADTARRESAPLVTVVRSGGTRLQEGMAALVGIPRARLALLALGRAGVPHLSVADAPTTGGVWISVAAAADLRVAVAGATVGFAGPRVVEAFTGVRPPADSHTALSAHRAGLVDAVLPPEQVAAWVTAVLGLLQSPTAAGAAGVGGQPPLPVRSGWEQVLAARARTDGGRVLLERLLPDGVWLQAPHGDQTVAARLGRADGRPVVGVAVAAELAQRPTPDGYRLATRAYRLAGRLGLPVVSLVDTPGADPSAAAERDGIAPAIAEALDALLTCPTPTVSVVHGEGGSGGALAATAADLVLATPDAYFAALGPEGAAAALRRPAAECADRMRITPADLLRLGAVDAVVPDAGSALRALGRLLAQPGDERRAARERRWSGPLPGVVGRSV